MACSRLQRCFQPCPGCSFPPPRGRKPLAAFCLRGTTGRQGDPGLCACHDRSGEPELCTLENRIATFDQDGTLWVEHPIYTQAMFALDRVRVLAPAHPEWKNEEPFKAILSGDTEAMAHFTEKDWTEIVGATHAGMSTDEFLDDCQAMAGDGQASALQAALHRARLSADARGLGLSARQRVQHLHRDRRRPGVRARL